MLSEEKILTRLKILDVNLHLLLPTNKHGFSFAQAVDFVCISNDRLGFCSTDHPRLPLLIVKATQQRQGRGRHHCRTINFGYSDRSDYNKLFHLDS
jgi:hypothetical protein